MIQIKSCVLNHISKSLATVITNLMSAIPWIGKDVVEFIWGGFSVSNATLNRFFSLHYLLPFILAALVVVHLIALHEHGSNNPLGISGNTDRLPFHPYFVFKDLVTVFIFLLLLSLIVFYAPNMLGHSDNYIPANPMQTPPSIVPEWYLLPFYAILRSIPNKLLGVIAMLASLLILFAMPILDVSRVRGSQFRPLMRWSFWLFVANFWVLMSIGSLHVEEPFITIGAISTIFYFSWFLAVVPLVGLIENTLADFSLLKKNSLNLKTFTLFSYLLEIWANIWNSKYMLDVRYGASAFQPMGIFKFLESHKYMMKIRFVGFSCLFIVRVWRLNNSWFVIDFLNANLWLLIPIYLVGLIFGMYFILNLLSRYINALIFLLKGKLIIRNSPFNLGGTVRSVGGYIGLGATAGVLGLKTYSSVVEDLNSSMKNSKEIYSQVTGKVIDTATQQELDLLNKKVHNLNSELNAMSSNFHNLMESYNKTNSVLEELKNKKSK